MRTSATLVSYQWIPDGENDEPVTFSYQRNFTVEAQLRASYTGFIGYADVHAESLPSTGGYSIHYPPYSQLNVPLTSFTDDLTEFNDAQAAGQMWIITGAKASTYVGVYNGSASSSSSVKVVTTSVTLVKQ